jgi:hypothetical protein
MVQSAVTSTAYKTGFDEVFEKAVDEDGGCLKYICNRFPDLTRKLKEELLLCLRVGS